MVQALVIWFALLGFAVILGAFVQRPGQATRWWLRWSHRVLWVLTIGALRAIGMVVIWPVAAFVRAYDHTDAQGQRRAQIAVGVIVALLGLAAYGFLIHNGLIRP